jgi:hypothetical protein
MTPDRSGLGEDDRQFSFVDLARCLAVVFAVDVCGVQAGFARRPLQCASDRE